MGKLKPFVCLILAVIFVSVSGCSSIEGQFDDAPKDYESVKAKYLEIKKEVQRKRDFYLHIKNELYPEVRMTVRDNWDQYTAEEKDLFVRADHKAKKLDEKITSLYSKLEEVDRKLNEGVFKRADKLYEAIKKLNEKKNNVSNIVNDIIDVAKKL